MGLAATIGTAVGGFLGIAPEVIAPEVIGGAILGVGTGAIGSEITGGNPLIGALTGGLTGGLVPAIGPEIGGALGIGTTAGEALTGAALGAGSSAITGGNPLIGAATGGAGPLLQSVAGDVFGSTGTPAAATSGVASAASPVSGAGTSAAGAAAPAGAALDPLSSGLLGSPDFGGGSVTSTGVQPLTSLSMPDVGGTPAGGTASPAGVPANIAPTSGSVDPLTSTMEATGLSSISLAPGLTGAAIESAPITLTGGAGGGGGGGGGLAPGEGDFGGGSPVAVGGASGGGMTEDATFAGATGGATGGVDTGGGTSGFSSDYLGGLLKDPNAYINATPQAQVAADVQQATLGGTASSDIISSAVPGTTTGGNTGTGGSFLGKLFGGSGMSSLLGPAALLGGGALLYDFMHQPKLPSVQSSLGPIQNTAQQLGAQGQQLQSYLQTGNLPPGVQQGIDQAVKSAQATIASRYAAMGTDPNRNSAALQDMQNAALMGKTQGANIAMNLLNTGIQESQLSAALYEQILNLTLSQDQRLSSAIGNFAASMVPRTVITQPATTSA